MGNTRHSIPSESEEFSWRQARNELMYELVRLARVNPDILVSGEGKDIEDFISFMKQKLCFNNILSGNDFFIVMTLLEYDLEKAVQVYSERIRQISPSYLLRKTRMVNDRISKTKHKGYGLAQEWEDFRDKNKQSPCRKSTKV